jgi:hypothetical protein
VDSETPTLTANAGLRHTASSKLDDEQRLGLVDGSGRALWPRRGIGQRGFAASQEAAKPLPDRLRCHAVVEGGLRGAGTTLGQFLD